MTQPATLGIQTYNIPPDQLIALARAADRLGFEGLWLGEHYVNPASFASVHPGIHNDASGREAQILGPHVSLQDPWFTLGAIAGATTRLRIGTAITIVPLIHPLLLARATATAWAVSGGRFRLGTGAGWLKEEFDALGIPFAERGSRLDEAIEILRKAWAGGYFEHDGRHFSFPEPQQMTAQPTPVPLVCGGNTGPALRRVVRVADAWMNSATVALDDACAMRDTIEAERRKAGTDRPLTYYLRPTAPDPALVEGFTAAGFENIVLWAPHIWSPDPAVPIAEKEARLGEVAHAFGLRPADPAGLISSSSE